MHSILDDGTWLRVENTNREMNAAEITTLSYKRGIVSAETELVEMDLSLLNTESVKTYCEHRGIKRGSLEQRLETIGLAKRDKGKCRPTKAAVLLFADSPSDLLALSGGRAGVRVFHYAGATIEHSENPNLRKPPKNITAPLYDLIEKATASPPLRSATVAPDMGFSMKSWGEALPNNRRAAIVARLAVGLAD